MKTTIVLLTTTMGLALAGPVVVPGGNGALAKRVSVSRLALALYLSSANLYRDTRLYVLDLAGDNFYDPSSAK